MTLTQSQRTNPGAGNGERLCILRWKMFLTHEIRHPFKVISSISKLQRRQSGWNATGLDSPYGLLPCQMKKEGNCFMQRLSLTMSWEEGRGETGYERVIASECRTVWSRSASRWFGNLLQRHCIAGTPFIHRGREHTSCLPTRTGADSLRWICSCYRGDEIVKREHKGE